MHQLKEAIAAEIEPELFPELALSSLAVASHLHLCVREAYNSPAGFMLGCIRLARL